MAWRGMEGLSAAPRVSQSLDQHEQRRNDEYGNGRLRLPCRRLPLSHDLTATDPAPVAIHSGTQAENERKGGHQNSDVNGALPLRAQRPPGVFPSRTPSLANSTMRIRVLPPDRSASPARFASRTRSRSAHVGGIESAERQPGGATNTGEGTNTATGVLSKTLNGSDQLRTKPPESERQTQDNPKIAQAGTPCRAFCS